MAKPLTATVKLKSGDKVHTFKQESCSTSKETATKEADKIRATGYKARVILDPTTQKHCVYKGSKALPKGKKK